MKKIVNTAQLKQMNMQLIRDALLQGETFTKKQISEATCLSLATCTVLLAELIEKGEVNELELAAPKGGRPARRFELAADYVHLLCLYVENEGGVHQLSYQVMNLKKHIIDEGVIGVESVNLEEIETLVSKLLAKFERIGLIGVGVPGIVEQGMIDICDIKCLQYMNLEQSLKTKFDKQVIVGNDMYFTSYGFYKMQHFETAASITVMAWPKGNFPGAGTVVDGYMIEGKTKFAGETSFLPYGVSREEQLRKLNDPKACLEIIGKGITSVVAIINPNVIALTGELLKDLSRGEIYKACEEYIPSKHLPEIVICPDIHEEYMEGIFYILRENLAF